MRSVLSFQATGAEITAQRNSLRRALKAQRNALTENEQLEAAHQLVERVLQNPIIQQASRIAIYHSVGAELNTQPLIKALLAAGKKLCLPVLHPFCKGHLLMLNYDSDTKLHLNRFAIPEPELVVQNIVPLGAVDCLLTPLVGFDSQGNRLGMGGGFYDRTLAGWAQGRYPSLQVIGLAHDCQHIEAIPFQPWDVPLPFVITPGTCWRFTKHSV